MGRVKKVEGLPQKPTVLVCGSRYWKDHTLIYAILQRFPEDTRIVHGDYRGADRIAGHWAEFLGLEVKAYPADWEKQGRGAGPYRNYKMLHEEKPHLVLAFHDNLQESRGTLHMLAIAQKAGVPSYLIESEEAMYYLNPHNSKRAP